MSTSEKQPTPLLDASLEHNSAPKVDPIIERLIVDPNSLSLDEKEKAFDDAKEEARHAPQIIMRTEDGTAYWGHEYDTFVFGKSGAIGVRGKFDQVPTDPTEYSTSMQLLSDRLKRGGDDLAIIEIGGDEEQSEWVVIKRTSDDAVLGAEEQTFSLVATRKNETEPIVELAVSTEALKDIVVAVGAPLVLGVDPTTGRRVRTGSVVKSITTVDTTWEVDAGNSRLGSAEYERDAWQRYEQRKSQLQQKEILNLGHAALELATNYDDEANSPKNTLTENYGHTGKEKSSYATLLKGAAEGQIDFSPLDNAKAFALSADKIEGSSGVGDIALTLDPTETIDKLAPSTTLKMAQQIRFARSLGFRVVGSPRIEDRELKLRIIAPREDTPYMKPEFKNGNLVAMVPRERRGETVPVQVVESLLAANFLKYAQDLSGERINLARECGSIMKQIAEKGYIGLPVQLVSAGGVSFYRAVAEGLGFRVGELRKGETFGEYQIPIEGRWPGFAEAVNKY